MFSMPPHACSFKLHAMSSLAKRVRLQVVVEWRLKLQQHAKDNMDVHVTFESKLKMLQYPSKGQATRR